ncbi:MAG: LAGLIDADG family homing endonuclease [Candidatus Aenigmarchaeota archaeon]|nr:LAGLIDADG family homing endonuclease [Candidatus Aenigmarchaeota archaeon]
MLNISDIKPTAIDKIKKVKVPNKVTNDLAYLCGVLAGDGSIQIQLHKHNYIVKCVGNPKDEQEFYEKILKPLIHDLFNLDIKMKYFDGNRSYGFVFTSKSIVLFLTKIIGLPSGRKDNLEIPKIFMKNKVLTKNFIQGFYDTDGCLSLKKRYRNENYYPVVTVVCKSENIIKQISNFLVNNGLTVCKYKRKYFDKRVNKTEITHEVTVYGHYKLLKWIKIIGFRHPKHLKKFALWQERNKERIAEGGVPLGRFSNPNLNSAVKN